MGALLGELKLALLVGLAGVCFLDEGLDVDLLLILLLLLDDLGKFFHFLFQFRVLFLLHDKLPDQELSVVLLSLELLLELGVLLDQLSVFGIDPLSDVRDQLQVVLHLVLSLLEVSFLITFGGLLLLHSVSHLLPLRVEFANDVLLLLVLQLLRLGDDVFDGLLDLRVRMHNQVGLCMLLGLLSFWYFFSEANDALADHSDFEVLLQLIDLLAVGLFPPDESLLSPAEIILYLVVLLHHFLRLLDDLGEALVPITRLRVLVRLSVVQVNLLHCIRQNKVVRHKALQISSQRYLRSWG